jgi:hypothetical protein
MKNFVNISNYAIQKVSETKQTYKIYLRVKADDYEYIAASPDSDMPDNSDYFGRFFWNGARVQWVKAHGCNES